MQTTGLTHARIAVPEDCLPLVADLVIRLGGKVLHDSGNSFSVQPMPGIERGGKMLKALRQRAGLTQKALAEAVGIQQSHISDFEKNRRAVPYKYAQRLADILHSIPSHFMTPNAETIAAMKESEEGKGKRFASAEALYKDLGI
jgi:transcriptional regulator with XRE-family HTH domain